MSFLSSRVPSAEEIIDLDSFDLSFLLLTGHVRLIEPFDASVKLLAQSYKTLRKTELWGPEVELATTMLRRKFEQHVQPTLLDFVSNFNLSGDTFSVKALQAYAAIGAIDVSWGTMCREALPALSSIIGTVAVRSTRNSQDLQQQASKAPALGRLYSDQEVQLLQHAAEDNVARYATLYGSDLHDEAKRLVKLVEYSKDMRVSDRLDLRNRLERFHTWETAGRDLSVMSDVQIGKVWNWTGLQKASEAGVIAYTIIAELDTNTCSVCHHLHGKEFRLANALDRMNSEMSGGEPTTANRFPVLNDVDNIPREAFVATGYYPPFHPHCRCNLVPLYRGTGTAAGRTPTLSDIANMDEAQSVAERNGIVISPNRHTGALPELNDLRSAFKTVNDIPIEMRTWAREHGLKMEFITGNGITDAESRATLVGLRPRGWPEGSTWDNVRGVGATKEDRLITVCINPVDYHRTVPQIIFHEFAHGLDAVALEDKYISETKPWKALWERLRADKRLPEPHNYFMADAAGPEELFADQFERWVNNDYLADFDMREYFIKLKNAMVRGDDWIHDPLIEPREWRKVGEQLGSNPGGVYLSPNDQKYYVKFYDNPDQAVSEAYANAVTNSFGLRVPKNLAEFVEIEGRKGLATRWMDDVHTLNEFRSDLSGLSSGEVEQITKQYLNAVLQGNWDWVGGAYDNLARVGDDWMVLDSGGSFRFRARGGSKAFSGTDISEWDSLLEPGHSGTVLRSVIETAIKEDPSLYLNWMSERVTDTRLRRILEELSTSFHNTSLQGLDDIIIQRRNAIIGKLSDVIANQQAAVAAQVSTGLDLTSIQYELTPFQKAYLDSFNKVSGPTTANLTEIQKYLHDAYQFDTSLDGVKEIMARVVDDLELRVAVPLDQDWNNKGRVIYDSIMKDGRIKSQMELGRHATSSGALSPHKGGSRDGWEETMGDGAFQKDPRYRMVQNNAYLPPELGRERPIYGYLADNPIYTSGTSSVEYASDQYGRVNLVLSKEAKMRASFSLGNSSSVYNDDRLLRTGTLNSNLNLLKSFFENNGSDTVNKFLRGEIRLNSFTGNRGYVESQIVGGVDLRKPGEIKRIIVLLKGDETVESIANSAWDWVKWAKAIAKKYKVPIEFKPLHSSIHLPLTRP